MRLSRFLGAHPFVILVLAWSATTVGPSSMAAQAGFDHGAFEALLLAARTAVVTPLALVSHHFS